LDGTQAAPTGNAADPLSAVFARARDIDARLTKLQGRKGAGAAATGGQTGGLPVGSKGGAPTHDPGDIARRDGEGNLYYVKRAEAEAEAQDGISGAVQGTLGGAAAAGLPGAVLGGVAGLIAPDKTDDSASGMGPNEIDWSKSPLFPPVGEGVSVPALTAPNAENASTRSIALQTNDAKKMLSRSHILDAPKSLEEYEKNRQAKLAYEHKYNKDRLSGK
jgi:hypothetical protein